jgi:hypothetical protein
MKNQNMVTKLNDKERVDTDTTKTVLWSEARSCLHVEDSDFNVIFLTIPKNKHFCSFLTYAYLKQIHEAAFLETYNSYAANLNDSFHPNLNPIHHISDKSQCEQSVHLS